MKAQFINVGRSRANRIVEVENTKPIKALGYVRS